MPCPYGVVIVYEHSVFHVNPAVFPAAGLPLLKRIVDYRRPHVSPFFVKVGSRDASGYRVVVLFPPGFPFVPPTP